MDPRTIYLHIGMHKTGTTSLQRFLYSNHDVLLRHGFLYPRLDAAEYAHYQHVTKIRQLESAPERFFAFIDDALRQRADASLLISSEYLDAVRHPDQRRSLVHRLAQLKISGCTVKIIVYLRRQDEFIESLYQSTVRNPKLRGTMTFPEFLHDQSAHLDYLAMLDDWAEEFGAGNLIVRIYAKDRLVNGSVIDDFLDILGIRSLDGFIALAKDANRSYSAGVIEYLRQTNRLRNEEDQTALFSLLQEAIPDEWLYKRPGERHHYLDRAQRLSLLDSYRDSNRKVAELFLDGNGGDLFEEACDDGANRLADASDETPLAIHARIQLHLYRQLAILRDDKSGKAAAGGLRKKLASLLD
jgi:hypothetical protein